MAKRFAFTYCVLVEMMRRDAAECQTVQMGNTVMAEDADEAKDIALVECSFSASENLPAWKVLRFDVRHIRMASDAAWT